MLGVLLMSTEASAAKTYVIEQNVWYRPPCGSSDLSDDLWDDTTALKSRMDAAGWSGRKWANLYAWERDFRESCSTMYGVGGSDYADTWSLAVFSGHGGPGMLYFGFQENTCNINIDNSVRLGQMGGGQAAIAMYISCSTLAIRPSGVPHGDYEWLHQLLGFHDVVHDKTSALGSFFDDTASKSNAQAWLDRMKAPAMVISYTNGWNTDCWSVSNGA